ncbi:MAG: type II toxin-antitoxin system Phd/YefM family antitoxin [Rhodomicrobium sp.]
MPTYTVHEAKTNLSKLIERAERGEEVIIARGEKPVVRLTAVAQKPSGRRFGAYKDVIPHFPDSFFFDPLPDDELALWEGDGHEHDPLNQPLSEPHEKVKHEASS